MFWAKRGKENKDDSRNGGSWKRVGIGFVIVGAILTLSVVGRSLVDEAPPQVVTNNATGIVANQATLNGDLTRRGETSPAYVSFEWGTSPHSYPNETEPEARVTSGAFGFDLTGLNPNTTYYYRAKAVGTGTSYGCEKGFKTTRLVTNNASDMVLILDGS